jgi:putative acetyltransferase
MDIVIAAERPDTPEATQLIEELEGELSQHYPAESRHGYSIEKLLKQNVAFFVTRKDGEAAGCGGIQLYGKDYGELKRMYVRPQFRGLGLARLMLENLAGHARENGVYVLRLETGIQQYDAIALYKKWGFQEISAFGEYKPDPLALFFEKSIS